MTPAMARAAPTSPESTTRERRMSQMTTSVVRSTAPVWIPNFCNATAAMVPQPTSMRPMPVARTADRISPRLKTMSAMAKRRASRLMPAPGFRQIHGPVQAQAVGRELTFMFSSSSAASSR